MPEPSPGGPDEVLPLPLELAHFVLGPVSLLLAVEALPVAHEAPRDPDQDQAEGEQAGQDERGRHGRG